MRGADKFNLIIQAHSRYTNPDEQRTFDLLLLALLVLDVGENRVQESIERSQGIIEANRRKSQ